MEKPILSIEHLNKSFGKTQVLKDINLQIFPGEIATIIGASGGGKTTLMRCATTLEYPNSGNISFAGITVCRDGIFAPPKTVREARKMFGMVFQSFNLFPHYSVWRNITDAPLNILRIAPKKVKEDAERMLEVFNLMSRKDAYPCELSNGQQQRVAIIRALLLKPRIMFFDEPTSALDPKMTRTVIETVKHLKERNVSTEIITHEFDFAAQISNRLIFLCNDSIVEEGTPEQMLNSPKDERTKSFIAKANLSNT